MPEHIQNSEAIQRPVLVSIINMNLEFIFACAGYSAFFNCKTEEITGRELSTVVGHEFYQETLPYLKNALKGNTTSATLTPFNNGEKHRVVESTFAPYFVNNEVSGVITTSIELLGRKAPANIRPADGKPKPAARAVTGDVVLVIDRKGVIVECISPGNNHFPRKHDFTPGLNLRETLPEAITSWVRNQFDEAIHSGPIAEFEYANTENGLTTHAEIRLITCSENEALLNIKNTTDRKNKEKLHELQLKLAEGLAHQHDLDRAMQFIIETMLQVEGIDCGGIYLIDPEDQTLVLKTHVGVSDDFAQLVRSFPAGSPQYEIAMSKRPLYKNYDLLFVDDRNQNDRDNILSIAAIPLVKEGDVIGIMNLGSRYLPEIPEGIRKQLESLSKIVGCALGKLLAEKRLMTSQQDFRQLFDTIDDYLFILDEQGNIILTNKVVEEQLKFTREELIGINVLNVHPPQRREEAGFIVSEMLGGRAKFCPVPLLTKDGIEIPVETRVVKGVWDNKKVLFGLSRDISERKKSERALIHKTEELETFFNVSLDLLCITTSGGKFVKVNKAWEEILGFGSVELQQKEILEFVHPDDLEPTRLVFEEWRQKNPVPDFTNRFKSKNGDYRFIEWRSVPVGELVYSAARDITARKQIELSLWDSLKHEKELNDLKSRFVSMASHEFRTPLASILMSTETLCEYRQKLNADQVDAMLLNIKEQISHLTNIVSNVMHLAKSHEGKLKVQLKETDMVSLVRKTVEKFNKAPELSQKIKVVARCATLTILTDDFLIVQILNNLIANALKYSEPQPIVTVSLSRQKSTVRIQVSDNGIGITPADQTHLFEPFFRGLNAQTKQGTGLGLSIVHESVKLLGGHVSVASKEGAGTDFTVELPIIHSY